MKVQIGSGDEPVPHPAAPAVVGEPRLFSMLERNCIVEEHPQRTIMRILQRVEVVRVTCNAVNRSLAGLVRHGSDALGVIGHPGLHHGVQCCDCLQQGLGDFRFWRIPVDGRQLHLGALKIDAQRRGGSLTDKRVDRGHEKLRANGGGHLHADLLKSVYFVPEASQSKNYAQQRIAVSIRTGTASHCHSPGG